MKNNNSHIPSSFLQALRQKKQIQPEWSIRRLLYRIHPIEWPSRVRLSSSTRQLATLIRADVPLVNALNLVSSQAEHKKIKMCYSKVEEQVQSGTSLATALASFPSIFDTLYIKMIEVGEKAGLLGEVLERLALHQEQADALKRKVQGALLYPTVILLVAIGATLILMTEVIPLFTEMFQQSKVTLPGPTRLVIHLSTILKNHLIVCMIMLSSAIIVLYVLTKRPGDSIYSVR